MWDYSFVFPTFLILLIILAFYFSSPRLYIRENRIFLLLILVETLTIMADIVSSHVDNEFERFPAGFVWMVNIAFFVLFFLRGFLFFKFTQCIVKTGIRQSRQVLICMPLLLSFLFTLTTPFTGALFSITGEGYRSGSWYGLTYVFALIYLLFSFGALAKNRTKLRRREWYCSLFFNGILLIGLVFRYLMPVYLLYDTFCMMAIIAIYLAFGNPEYYLTLRGSIFNGKAFRDTIEDRRGRLHHRCLGVAVHKFPEMRDIYGSEQMEEGMYLIGRFLVDTFPGETVYYYGMGRFILLGDRKMDLSDKCAKLKARFHGIWKAPSAELSLEAGAVTWEMTDEVAGQDDLIHIVSLAFKKADATGLDQPVEVTLEDLGQAMRETVVKRSLEYAIEHDGIDVYLQPIVEAATGKVMGAEALSRVWAAGGNMISPELFIPIAENNGRINELGEVAFEKTCRFIRDHDLKAMGIGWINVNLSPQQFLRTDLADRLAEILNRYGLTADVIHLEITEQSLIDDVFLRKQMELAEKKGFKFVLDDYGTGYSNITRLKQCSFTSIKLDMSVVWDYCEKPDDILPNMIRAFKDMGFTVTAEGIENAHMAETMKSIGCDYLQGFHYSKPVPMEEFAQKVQNA